MADIINGNVTNIELHEMGFQEIQMALNTSEQGHFTFRPVANFMNFLFPPTRRLWNNVVENINLRMPPLDLLHLHLTGLNVTYYDGYVGADFDMHMQT